MKSHFVLKLLAFVIVLTLSLLVVAPGLLPNARAQFGPCFEVQAGATDPVFRGTAIAFLPYTYDTRYFPTKYNLNFDPAASAWGFQNVSLAPLGNPIQVSIPAGAPPGTYFGNLSLREERPMGERHCDSNDSPFSITIVACPVPPPSRITVNSLFDTPDANLADGVCNDGTGKCTLRAAIAQANSLSVCGPLQINFSVNGTINLGSPLPDITQSLTILGPGARQLTVEGNPAIGISDFRIFKIPNPGLNVMISGLTISRGRGISSVSNLTLTDCAITGSNAPGEPEGDGAGVYLKNADGVITGCTISGNTAAFKGGGIYYQGDGGHRLRLSNCTISGNTVTNPFNQSIFGGGGIFHASEDGSSTLEVMNCTITNNMTATMKAGGIMTSSSESGNVATTFLRNTIIAGNTAPNLMRDRSNVVSSLGNNLTDDNGGGFLTQASDKLNSNPLLGPLTDNGGHTQTCALLAGSPAINAGSDCVTQAPVCLPAPLTTDQRGSGFPRKFGSTVDIGAFEARVDVPARLIFGMHPTGTTPSTIISPAVTVHLLDDTASLVTSSSATISLVLGNNPGGATLGGSTNVAAAGGVATFNNLSVNQAGVGYRLVASSGGLLGATSNAFDICPVIVVTAGTVPAVIQRTTSTLLPYTVSTGSPNQYSIDYDAAAEAAGFSDVTNAALPASPIMLSLPGTAPTGTYQGILRLRVSGSGCSSSAVPFTVTILPCSTVPPPPFTVNSLGDTPDANLTDGLCNDGTGNCTLRAAIQQANALGACAPLQVNFSVNGTINLATGLPVIIQSMALQCPGASQLTVQRSRTNGTPDFRIFTIPFPGVNIAISGLTISNGKAPLDFSQGSGLPYVGGGIFSRGNLTLTDCAIIDNEAPVDTIGFAGGVYLAYADGVFTGCTISGNKAATKGAGIYYQGDGGHKLLLSNCTISGNTANFQGLGAGIYHHGREGESTLEVTNCTIVNNIVVTPPPLLNCGGIFTDRDSSASGAVTRLRNNIIANNTLPNVDAFASDATNIFNFVFSLGNNLVNDDGCSDLAPQIGTSHCFFTQASDKLNTNPLLGPLTDNGGPTQTCALLAGSPAINAGSDCVLTNNCASNNLGFNMTTDQRGTDYPRKFGSAVDIGAYEMQAPAGAPTHLAFGVQPASATPGSVITPAITVRVLDAANNLVTASSATINLAFGNNPSGSALGGTTSVAAAGGVATFSNLSVNLAGSGYTLAASSGGLEGAASNAFNIGNTSTNTAPTIIATPVTRNAGSASAISQIASVMDAQDAENTLMVSVNGGASATINGVTVNTIGVSAAGIVTAEVVATCGATTANFTLRVTDGGGLSNEATLTVTINPDNQPPTLACPANIMKSADSGVCTATVTYATPTATDNCTGVGTVTCSPTSGSVFPKGTTTVTCSGADAVNNIGTCSFTITIIDSQSPTLSACPANQNVTTTSGCVNVAYTPPTVSDNCPGASVSCAPPSGSCFAIGTTTVTCTGTDTSSNTATCSFTMTVTPCSITCPANVTVNAASNLCTAVVSYSAPTTRGSCGSVSCTPPSGSTFSKGTTTVTCTTQTGPSCTFTVTVNDTQAPNITCPAPVTQATDKGQCQAVVSYANATATDNCPAVGTPACSPASGSIFTKGVTTVNCTVSDATGNTGSCNFTVTVNDSQAPTITCSTNITMPTTAGQCAAVVSFATPQVTDNCPNVGAVVCSPTSGTSFAKGVTTVTCTVADSSGNSKSCSFTVTINDTQLPQITCPANLTRPTDAGLCTAIVTYTTTATDNCPGVTVSCNPPSASSFPKGTTTVACVATDTTGNTASCSFTVTVTDNQAPQITCPPNQTRVTTRLGAATVVVNYPAPTFSDNCVGAIVSCVPPSGSAFPLGTTTVTCTASDAAGNTATCSFTVTVFDICLQDDYDPTTVLLWNSQTGAYRYCCRGTTLTGVGTVVTRGSVSTLDATTADRRLVGRSDQSVYKGTASLQFPLGTTNCAITDRDTRNNSCLCQ